MFHYSISIAGICIRFSFPERIQLPDVFSTFRCSELQKPDFIFTIQLIEKPLPLPETPVYTGDHMEIYRINDNWLRVYTPLTGTDGCQVACLLSATGSNILYYPASKWGLYASAFQPFHLIGAELLLLQHHAFLLHSSVVLYQGKMILFSGPSGVGKSTQASLWEHHMGAKVINGDRCVILQKEDGFYGSGSPWAGTSAIYHNIQAPIAGIIVLSKGSQNQIRKLGFEAFSLLFSQTTVNSWDHEFMSKIMDLYENLFRQVPIYALQCCPDEDAVKLVHNTLF